MAERVKTGGLIEFDYSKGEKKKLTEEQEKEIEDAYVKYDERKRKERKKKITIILLIILLIVLSIGVITFWY